MSLLRLLFTVFVGAVTAATAVAFATSAAVDAVPAVDPLDAVEPVLARLSDAPPLPQMPRRAPERSVMLAADGSVLGYLVGAENRVRLTWEEIPVTFVDALLAAEDDRFYEHRGVDLAGIVRAYLRNVEAGEIQQGGSTITQQLVENTILPDARTYKKKIEEAWYAVQLEQELSKDEILQRYLNRVYFGAGAYGIAAAAERYFSATVDELRVDQVALLIGIVRAPSALNPIDNPDGAREVRDLVLRRMAETRRLGAADARAARTRPLDLDPKEPPKPRFPFFAEYVRHQLLTSPEFDDVLGKDPETRESLVYGGGLTIHTTLRPKLQRAANRAIRKVVKQGKRPPQAVVVTVRPGTGNVQAMAVGPRSFGSCTKENKRRCRRTMVNPAVQELGGSGRQPGSAFKPFVAAAALQQGIPRGWELETEGGKRIPGCRDGDEPYKPHNYSPSPGLKDMTEAMRVSSNVYFAKLAGEIGPRRVVKTAKAAGLRTANLPEGCAVALGSGSVTPLEMASAYATFAANGRHCHPRAVLRIEMRGEEHTFGKRCERVMPKNVAKTVTALLREPVESGTATAVDLNRQVAGKTGTTQDYRDAWFVGYARQLATATWIGHEQPAPLRNVLGRAQITGGSAPAELFTVAMKRMLRGVERKPLPRPDVRRIAVPPLRGERLADVREDLDYRLQLEVARVTHHRPRGTIVRQSPRAGARVDAGATITVRVSDGRGESPAEKRAKARAAKRAEQEARKAQRRAEKQARDAAEALDAADGADEADETREAAPDESEPKSQPRGEPGDPRPSDDEPQARDEPSPEPTQSEPEPTEPEPAEPDPSPEPEPTDPDPEPSPEPDPEPSPEPEPSDPQPSPEPEPTQVEPSPEPTQDGAETEATSPAVDPAGEAP